MQSKRTIAPLDEGSSRQIWVGWGSALMCLALAYLIAHFVGGTFIPVGLLFIGATIALRGHKPGWFIKHIDAQIIAGIPGRNVPSWRAWLAAIVIAMGFAETASRMLEWRNPTQQTRSVKIEPCKITAITDSFVVARVYSRGPLPKPPQKEVSHELTIQELFYDWVLTLSANQYAGDVVVVLKDDQKPVYRFKVDPTEATVSDAIPSWMSGFTEPRAPDYYKRIIRWEHLNKIATITIRRPIKFERGTNGFDASSFPASGYEVNSSVPCAVDESNIYDDPQKRFLRLITQVWSLSNWRYGKQRQPTKILLDPDAPLPSLQPGEAEVSIEARCKDDPCKEIVVHQLEARVNRVAGDPTEQPSANK